MGPDYSGVKPGRILSLVFLAKNIGQGAIEINNAKVLLNDGKGTQASLSISNFQFSISKEISGFEFQVLRDTDPPEDFKPEIAQDPNIFEGKWFLVFVTQDKGSGIDHYEIQETRNKRQGKNWVEAESPYVLKNQNLRSYIYVKAVDKAGNERVTFVEPKYPMKWYEKPFIWSIIILSIIIGYILWKIAKSKSEEKNSKS